MKAVPAHEVERHWPLVERGCNAIIRKARRVGCESWFTPEDIRTYLNHNRAFLLLVDGGFLVIEQRADPAGTLFLNIWLAFLPNAAKQKRQELIADLDRLKAESKSAWLQFESPFDGWIAIEPDFKRYMVTWRRS